MNSPPLLCLGAQSNSETADVEVHTGGALVGNLGFQSGSWSDLIEAPGGEAADSIIRTVGPMLWLWILEAKTGGQAKKLPAMPMFTRWEPFFGVILGHFRILSLERANKSKALSSIRVDVLPKGIPGTAVATTLFWGHCVWEGPITRGLAVSRGHFWVFDGDKGISSFRG